MPKNLNLNDDFSDDSDACDIQEDRLSDVQEEGSLREFKRSEFGISREVGSNPSASDSIS
jgi:hypothetical protein